MDLAELQRHTYDTVLENVDGAFVTERPPLFSPAITVQDEQNGKGSLHQWAAMYLPTEYTDWVDESRAHVETCYLGDWSALAKIIVYGPEAHGFLSWLGMNDLSSFEIGQIKHHVQLDENAFVASEGVICRLGEEEFLYTAGGTEWLEWQFGQGGWDAELRDVNPDYFIFGVQGPNSLDVMQQLTDGDDLQDIAFNRSREATVAGVDMRVLRTGISGELGYELHGPAQSAADVWAAIRDVGEEFGIRQLGGRAQSVQHIEAGIATNGLDYFPSSAVTPGAARLFRRRTVGGSFVPQQFTDLFRMPFELGWGLRSDVAAHDFLGRDALVAARADGPKRVLVGLVWNDDDIADVWNSPLSGGEIYEQMDLPRRLAPSFDEVRVHDEPVGVSSGRTLSVNLRQMISICVIEVAHSEPGTEAIVVWGRAGGPQKEIRAEVVKLPFKPDRRRTDVAAG